MTKKKPSLRERGRAVTLPPSSHAAGGHPPPSTGAPADKAAPPSVAGAQTTSERPPRVGSNPPGTASRVFTGVGRQMAEGNLSLTRELSEVRQKLADYEGSIPLRLLDPKRIRRSKYANRHPSEFLSADFQRLKQQLIDAGVNIQPIKVRPISGDPDFDFEVAFGHRRHQGTLEAGIEVLAFIEEMSDQELWLVMARENLERKDMSPWEQGKSLLQAMETGLFSSNRKLASELGIDQSNALKMLSLARLPDAIVGAFVTPTELQLAWAKPLSDALQKDPDGVIARAAGIAAQNPKPSSKRVFDALTGESAASRDKAVTVSKGKKVLAVIKKKGKGGLSVTMPEFSDIKAVEEAVRKLLGA
jgi:ParB family chromosome partitioning protein